MLFLLRPPFCTVPLVLPLSFLYILRKCSYTHIISDNSMYACNAYMAIRQSHTAPEYAQTIHVSEQHSKSANSLFDQPARMRFTFYS
jgi:hypothetical protein